MARFNWIFSFVLTVFVVFVLFRLQPEVPLFYSLLEPEQQLASKYMLLLIPAISVSINLLHSTLLYFFSYLDELIRSIFIWSTTVMQVLLSLALLRIIFIIS